MLTINQIASFGDKNVGLDKHIDVSNITLSGADAGNYVLGSTSGSATGDITRAHVECRLHRQQSCL